MKTGILVTHLVFVGVWLGCVLTEALFERALLGHGRDKEKILANLHKKVDIIVEIPAFIIVLVTGGLLLAGSVPSTLLFVKVSCGIVALLANVYCICLVFRRAACALNDDWDGFVRLDDLQHKYGALVLLGILGALAIGIYMAISI
jgi:hypothetical protein